MPGPCEDVRCSDQGLCAVVDGKPVCVCNPGFHSDGLDCVEDTDPCAPFACTGHGTCGLVASQPSCLCEDGFHDLGPTECERDVWPCDGVDCDGNGVCGITVSGQPWCACAAGYSNLGATHCRTGATPLSFGPPTPADGALVGSTIVVAGNCTAGQQITVSGDLGAVQQPSCDSADSFTTPVEPAAPDGPKVIQAAQQVPGYAAELIERHFILDTTPPAPAFCCATPPAGATLTLRHMPVEGICEAGLDVVVAGDVVVPVVAGCGLGSFAATIELASGDGPKSFSASQTDAAGNSGHVARSVQLQLPATALVLAGPAVVAANSCEKYTVTAHDADGVPKAVLTDVVVVLGGEGHGSYYSDDLCTNGPITDVGLVAGQQAGNVFFKGRVAERLRLSATSSRYSPANLDVTVQPKASISQPGGSGAGQLEYLSAGRTFDFRFLAADLQPGTDYTLIYFPDHATTPTSGDNLICLASGGADSSGRLVFDDGSGGFRSIETDTDLPSGYDDRFYTHGGARILLVYTSDVDCVGNAGVSPPRMVLWNDSQYLLNDDVIEFDDIEVTHLVKKDAAWTPLPGSYYGELHFEPVGPTFAYSAQFRGLDPMTAYTLIYYHDPWAGRYARCLGSGSADPIGALTIADNLELDSGLPSLTDPNYSYAKIWLIRSADVDCATPQVLALNVSTIVFDYGDGLRYQDTDHPRVDVEGVDGSVLVPVACKQSSTAFQNVAFAARSDSFVIWFTGKPASTSGRAITGVASGRVDSEPAIAASIVFDQDGQLRAWHGGNADYQADSALSYSVGAKGIYRFRFDIDVVNHSYSVAVLSGEDGADWVTLAASYPFRVEQGAVTALDSLVFFSPTADAQLICGASVE